MEYLPLSEVVLWILITWACINQGFWICMLQSIGSERVYICWTTHACLANNMWSAFGMYCTLESAIYISTIIMIRSQIQCPFGFSSQPLWCFTYVRSHRTKNYCYKHMGCYITAWVSYCVRIQCFFHTRLIQLCMCLWHHYNYWNYNYGNSNSSNNSWYLLKRFRKFKTNTILCSKYITLSFFLLFF